MISVRIGIAGKHQQISDMDSSYAATSDTVISDLNDDCLLEVFQYLDVIDLCAAADACHRFRQNAQAHFASPKSKNDVLHIVDSDQLILRARNENSLDRNQVMLKGKYDRRPNQKLQRISILLRNFGISLKSIHVYGRKLKYVSESNYDEEILGLISRYCTLNELRLNRCSITGGSEFGWQHLKKLSFHNCICSSFFVRTLSFRSPELRELHFSYNLEHPNRDGKECEVSNTLYQSFPKLELISFKGRSNVKNIDIDEFLKLNPQLRKIGFVHCQNIDGSIFQSIAKYVPDIEAIQMDRFSKMDNNNVKCVGKLESLTTLKLCSYSVDNAFMQNVLNEIHAGDIPLQQLHVLGSGHRKFRNVDQLINVISKLKRLKTLWLLGMPGLQISHIFGLCQQLEELSEINLQRNEVMMSANDLIIITKYAQKLQLLQYFEDKQVFDAHKQCEVNKIRRSNSEVKENIGDKTIHVFEHFKLIMASIKKKEDQQLTNVLPGFTEDFVKLVEIVSERREKRCFLIKLNHYNPIAASIPLDLAEKYCGTLAFEVENRDSVNGWVPFFFNEVDA